MAKKILMVIGIGTVIWFLANYYPTQLNSLFNMFLGLFRG